MKQKNKLLQLKKETLIALQEKQLRSIHGGRDAESMSYCVPSQLEPCYPLPTQPEPPAPQSCCKKTCKGEQES